MSLAPAGSSTMCRDRVSMSLACDARTDIAVHASPCMHPRACIPVHASRRHVAEVLAPQGHPMLITSRPAGLRDALFAMHFQRLRLGPLSEAQQLDVIAKRVGSDASIEALPRYLRDKVPLDAQTGARVTGNPLMLSVAISIFEGRRAKAEQAAKARSGGGGRERHVKAASVLDAAGHGAGGAAAVMMPSTTVELYDVASKAVLEREGLLIANETGGSRKGAKAATNHLLGLLEVRAHGAWGMGHGAWGMGH